MNMPGGNENSSTYHLISDLIKQIVRTHCTRYQTIQEKEQADLSVIKKLRSKAFGILLKKTNNIDYPEEWPLATETSVMSEILKYAFTLKLAFRQTNDAMMLEHLLDEVTDDPMEEARVTPILIFLMQLKQYRTDTKSLTSLVSYGKTLGDPIPLDYFPVPDMFATALETQKLQLTRNSYSVLKSEPCLPYIFRFTQQNVIEPNQEKIATSLENMGGAPIPTLTFPSEWCLSNLAPTSPFIPEIVMDLEPNETEHIMNFEKALVPGYPYTIYKQPNEINIDSDSSLQTWKLSEENHSSKTGQIVTYCTDTIWNEVNINDLWISKSRSWEFFGQISPKEVSFITDLPNAVVHLARIKETASLPLLMSKTMERVPVLEEVPIVEFLTDVKSLLLGLESNCFKYEESNGFALCKHISVYGVSPRVISEVCNGPIIWGNCYKFLSSFVAAEPQTGKLRQEGLIFQAVCTNVQELLLYYRVSLLRVMAQQEKSMGLLKLLDKARPLAKLIVETAKLCGYDGISQKKTIEPNNMLTHIYQEVVKVTDNKVAMVFYSILKSCCEVYFRFLQKWMFEGVCDDIYGEFMITARPQYLRNRGHKFWRKGFTISNNAAVPGFLHDLQQSVLECGKTVRLLRICDIKNPVCNVCTIEQPEVRVCLSVVMLRDQVSRCCEYEEKGNAALGPILSISSAIQERKRIGKEMEELAIHAQRETLARLNEQREEALRDEAENKRQILANLKHQAEEDDLRKKQRGRTNLDDDPRYHKQKSIQPIVDGEIETRRENISQYYNDLVQSVEVRRLRAEWRRKRMSHYDQRCVILLKNDFSDLENTGLNPTIENNATVELTECHSNATKIQPNMTNLYGDENKNFMDNVEPKDNKNSSPMTIINVNSGNDNVRRLEPQTEEISNQVHVETELPMNRVYRKQNETSALQDFLKEEALKQLDNKMFNKPFTRNPTVINDNATISYNKLSGAFVERPTHLSIGKLDNITAAWMATDNARKKIDMTPNNNELKAELILNDDHSGKDRKEVLNENESIFGKKHQQNNLTSSNLILDLETPMSCTTDNFASSSQSPMSQLEVPASMQASSSFTMDLIADGTPGSSQLVQSPEILIHDRNSIANSNLTTPLYPLRDGAYRDWFTKSVRNIESHVSPAMTLADVEMLDHTSLKVYLRKSILIPLEVQSRLVNNAIIKYFLKEHDLLSHLHSLRSYFFLLNGEFAKTLTDSIYSELYKISTPTELFNSTTLTNVLERALVNSFNNVSADSAVLSLSAVDTSQQFHISDPAALDCLCLNYKISWPLNIILDDTVMTQYGKVFKFLITSGRVSWVLQEDFNVMKKERNAATSEQYHKLQLYRHAMTQFMNALHNYLTCSVLHSSWAEFEKDLLNSSTLDQIYTSHVNYIKRILSRCMLNIRGGKIRICLNNIFKVILKFHNRLRSQVWIPHKSAGYVHPNFKKLELMYGAFCEQRAYMAHVAYKLATSGYQPHLMHFLNALNLNDMYDLSVVKTGRPSTRTED